MTHLSSADTYSGIFCTSSITFLTVLGSTYASVTAISAIKTMYSTHADTKRLRLTSLRLSGTMCFALSPGSTRFISRIIFSTTGRKR